MLKRDMRLNLILLIFLITSACNSTPTGQNRYTPETPEVSEKYSLSADRAALDELRKDIPQSTQVKNDEEALILQLMSENKKDPVEVRRVFDGMVRKKRDLFDKDMNKTREQFNKTEKEARDEFLKKSESDRKVFNKKKRSKEERAEFYNKQDETRREYFANERDRRQEFESVSREKRKDFEDHVRSRTNDFNQEVRAYGKRLEDLKKAERERAQSEPKP